MKFVTWMESSVVFASSSIWVLSYLFSSLPHFFTATIQINTIILLRWFVIGSVVFAISSIVTVVNSYHQDSLLGHDDSSLNKGDFRATWLLMVASGVFCTLGELQWVQVLFSSCGFDCDDESNILVTEQQVQQLPCPVIINYSYSSNLVCCAAIDIFEFSISLLFNSLF